jgi:two-component system, NtrC family, sensor histidine kinase PilS
VDAAEANAADPNGRRALDKFLVLRTIVASLVVGAGVTIVGFTDETFAVRPLYTVLVLSVLVGAAAYGATRLGAPTRRVAWVVTIADVGLEMAIVHYSGGAGGQFTTVFCLTIAAAAFVLAMPGGLATAMLSSLCFVGYQAMEAHGWMTPPGRELFATSRAGGVIDAYMHASMFFLVGTLGGYLADRIKLKGRALENAETALEQLRVDTNYILENMSSGVLVVDESGIAVTMNAAAGDILEIGAGEVVGRDVKDALGPRVPELVGELTAALASARGTHRKEIAARTRAGDSRPLGISISFLTEDSMRQRGAIAVFQDLTEVHEMRERVRKADRLAAIGELSAGIAHELRNPLASISGSIEMLYNELKLDGENTRLMELIMRESDRLDRIISDFLDFAKLRTPSKSPARLKRALEETLMLLSKNAEKSEGITTRLECDPRLPEVWMDDEQMRQVFLNLAINACEAMDRGGTLEITAVAPGNGLVRVSFTDNGPGIDPQEMARMFEPFFTTKEGGTGLGLAIANKIVVAHGGVIEYRNREQRGAEFTIVLPVGAPADPTKRATAGRQIAVAAE